MAIMTQNLALQKVTLRLTIKKERNFSKLQLSFVHSPVHMHYACGLKIQLWIHLHIDHMVLQSNSKNYQRILRYFLSKNENQQFSSPRFTTHKNCFFILCTFQVNKKKLRRLTVCVMSQQMMLWLVCTFTLIRYCFVDAAAGWRRVNTFNWI